MREVICLYCREKFKREEVEFEKVGNRYAHKTCYDEKHAKKTASKKDIRKCLYCSGEIDISKEEYCMPRTNRYAHKKCYENNYSPDDEFIPKIYDYLKSQKINYNYPECERQRIHYITKLGYTNEGVLNALKYFYSVKKQSPGKSGNRIGIVPYVYDEAKEYYLKLTQRQKQIARGLEKQIQQEDRVILVTAPEKKVEKGYIDIDSIGSD